MELRCCHDVVGNLVEVVARAKGDGVCAGFCGWVPVEGNRHDSLSDSNLSRVKASHLAIA